MVTAWYCIGVSSNVECLVLVLARAQMLHLLEEPRQEPQEILA